MPTYGRRGGDRNELALLLGPHQFAIESFIRRVANIPWMQRAGSLESTSPSVQSVPDLATAMSEYAIFRRARDTLWNCLSDIALEMGKGDAFHAAQSLNAISKLTGTPVPAVVWDEIWPEIVSDVRGAMLEILLDEIVRTTLFRESIEWYERGHWLCRIRSDGTRVIW